MRIAGDGGVPSARASGTPDFIAYWAKLYGTA